MNVDTQWLIDLEPHRPVVEVDGLIPVDGYQADKLQPEQVVAMEYAAKYGAKAVFFEAGRNGRALSLRP